MESTDLFSHPEKAEFVSTDRTTSTAPVENPEFSDGKTPSAKPNS